MRSFKRAVTTKWEAKYIKRITKASGAEWEPCSSPDKIDMDETGLTVMQFLPIHGLMKMIKKHTLFLVESRDAIHWCAR